VSAAAWGSAIALALLCTGLAYILYFRLIAHAGATNAMTVTFLIPVFAMAWGWLVLAERPSADMLIGAAVILAGTALATGLARLPVQTVRKA
jgi:drug/metabolite transporter (DMT)-like permease